MNKNSRGFATFSLHERGFAPILIVIVLGLIGVVVYFVFKPASVQLPTPSPTPTPSQESQSCKSDEDCPQPMCIPGEEGCYPYKCINETCQPDYSEVTADWKTYSNEEVGISFNYPSDLIEAGFFKGEENAITTSLKNDIYTLVIMSGISKSENYEISPEGFEQFINDVSTQGPNGKKFAVDSQPAAQSSIEYGQTKITTVYIISKNNSSLVTLSLQTTKAKEAIDYEETLDQILSTFKFLPSDCGECPQYSPPSADFCKDGEIISGRTDECGCQLPPTCKKSPPVATNGCVIGGCSGEICAEEELSSTCIYRPEAVCLKTATCERQANGNCGWTQAEELKACLAQY